MSDDKIGFFGNMVVGLSKIISPDPDVMEIGQAEIALIQVRQSRKMLNPDRDMVEATMTPVEAFEYLNEMQEDYGIDIKKRKFLKTLVRPILKKLKDKDLTEIEILKEHINIYDTLSLHAAGIADKEEEVAVIDFDNFWMATSNQSNKLEHHVDNLLNNSSLQKISPSRTTGPRRGNEALQRKVAMDKARHAALREQRQASKQRHSFKIVRDDDER